MYHIAYHLHFIILVFSGVNLSVPGLLTQYYINLIQAMDRDSLKSLIKEILHLQYTRYVWLSSDASI